MGSEGTFRAGQAEAISTMIENFESGVREQTLDAPTAAGKTLDLVALGNILVKEFGVKKVLFTSPQVALIETGNLFGIPKLVGKSNYKCLGLEGCTADDCIFGGKKSPVWAVCDECPYRGAKSVFNNADFGATTFARYIVDPNIKRETAFLVVDESTNLPNALIEESALEVPENVFQNTKTKGVYEALTAYWIALKELAAAKEARLEVLREQLETNNHPNKRDIDEMKKAQREFNAVNRDADAAHKAMMYVRREVPYVLTTSDELRYSKGIRGKVKTKVHKFCLLDATEQYASLISGLKGIVLASGTPTTKLLTTDPVHKYVKIQHPIEASRRTVTYTPIGKMSMDERYRTAKPMAQKIIELQNVYHRNMIVHAGNYEIANLLLDHMTSVDKVILQDRDHRKEDLLYWMEQDDTIFLSVHYEEGIDLKGEKFPVNVVAKVPFPNLGDQWVKARNDLDNWMWYNMTAAIAVMQACGRTTRTPDDYSETYILDASWGGFYSRNRVLFPDWFVAAYRT